MCVCVCVCVCVCMHYIHCKRLKLSEKKKMTRSHLTLSVSQGQESAVFSPPSPTSYLPRFCTALLLSDSEKGPSFLFSKLLYNFWNLNSNLSHLLKAFASTFLFFLLEFYCEHIACSCIHYINTTLGDFPGGTEGPAKTPCSQCRGSRFNPQFNPQPNKYICMKINIF